MTDTDSGKRTDFLGNEYGPGDIIVYAAMSGRSVTMVKARVVTIRESTVTVQPLASSRWKLHGSSRYVDSRTGKGINPWAESGKHIEVESHWVNPAPGETRSSICAVCWPERDNWEHVPTKFKEYVVEERSVKPVTLKVLENIVKISDGEELTDAA